MNYEGTITPAYIQLADAPTRTDEQQLRFVGWTDVADSGEGKWTAGQENVEFKNKENTLYAVWKQGYWCTVCNDKYYEEEHYSCDNGHHYTELKTGQCGFKDVCGCILAFYPKSGTVYTGYYGCDFYRISSDGKTLTSSKCTNNMTGAYSWMYYGGQGTLGCTRI